MRIEAVTLLGLIRAVNPVAVQQARACLRQIAMPDLVGAFLERNALDFAPPALVEQAQLDFLGILREQGEIDPLAVPVRTPRMGAPRPDRGYGARRRFYANAKVFNNWRIGTFIHSGRFSIS